MEISKTIPQNLDYSERNQILPKNDTQKSGNSPKRYTKIREQPQKSTQNNGTFSYHDIRKLPPPPHGFFIFMFVQMNLIISSDEQRMLL